MVISPILACNDFISDPLSGANPLADEKTSADCSSNCFFHLTTRLALIAKRLAISLNV
jgi:hypothetical protein